MCKDHTYPEELKRRHCERMVRRMVADGKEVERLVDGIMKKTEKNIEDAIQRRKEGEAQNE
jgi:hypothetical protein